MLRSAPHLFVVLECDRLAAGGARYALEGVGEVVLGRGPERRATRETRDGIVTLRVEIPGRSMSARHARLVRSHGRWILEDLGSRNGVFVEGARVEREALRDGAAFELGHTLFVLATALPTPAAARDVDARELANVPLGLASLLPELEPQADAFARVARSDVTIVLQGETGTGKDLLARAAHALSKRAGAFVAVNCGAISPLLVESQLFGHEKGAFSGAVRAERGFVRAAEGGTLFLDEAGDLPLPAQAALLRVLENREVVPVGASRAVHVDVRVVVATHRSLEADVTAGRFRADLHARIAGYTHTLRPLRERKVDLGLVLAEAVRAAAPSASLHPAAGRALLAHTWPQNAREVRQCVTAASVLAAGDAIRPAHLPPAIARLAASPAPPAASPRPRAAQDDLDDLDDEDSRLRAALIAALRSARGNVAEVARSLGKGPTQIHRWMKRLGLDPAAYRD